MRIILRPPPRSRFAAKMDMRECDDFHFGKISREIILVPISGGSHWIVFPCTCSSRKRVRYPISRGIWLILLLRSTSCNEENKHSFHAFFQRTWNIVCICIIKPYYLQVAQLSKLGGNIFEIIVPQIQCSQGLWNVLVEISQLVLYCTRDQIKIFI